jgi:hypothetical protein
MMIVSVDGLLHQLAERQLKVSQLVTQLEMALRAN